MSANEIHIGDIGTAIRCTIKDDTSIVDVSGASVLQLIFRKPDGTITTKDASFYTNGSDGIIQFITTSSFLDQVGTWKVEGYVVINDGHWKSDIKRFKCHRVLN